MTDVSGTHLCINCEEAKRNCFVTLTTDGKCSCCNSDAVIDLAKLPAAVEDVGKKKAIVGVSSTVREMSLEESTERYLKMRNESSGPVRAFLKRNKFDVAEAWWDGWGSCVGYSIPLVLEANAFEYFNLTLTNADQSQRIITMFWNHEDVGMYDETLLPSKRKTSTTTVQSVKPIII